MNTQSKPVKPTLTVTYEIEDGYSGGARPQRVKIPFEDFRDCADIDSAIKMTEEYIQDDFNQKAYPSYDIDAIRTELEKILKTFGTNE